MTWFEKKNNNIPWVCSTSILREIEERKRFGYENHTHWDTTVIIFGKGEIGSALGFIAERRGFWVHFHDPPKGLFADKPYLSKGQMTTTEIIHICFPIKNVSDFQTLVDYITPNHTVIIVDATVPLGLLSQCQKIFPTNLLLHSPVRGRHPTMVDGLHKYVKFVGPADPTRIKEAEEFCQFYYTRLGIPYKVLSSADACALGKLLDTTWYLTQIVFANQVSLICAKHHLNFNEVYTQFQETGDTGVKFENIDGRAVCNQFVPRPVMVPGAIGGHCLLPNLEILKPDISPAYYSWVKQMHEYFAGQLNQMVEQNANVIPLKHDGDRE